MDTDSDEPCIKWQLLGLPLNKVPASQDRDSITPTDDPPTSELCYLADRVFTHDDNVQLEDLLSEFPDVLSDKPGRTNVSTHHIDTGDSPPSVVLQTAFICKEGLFQFRVLPFDVVNGPASFQRLMETVLHDLIGQTCYVYLDDVVCYSPSVSQHFTDLRQILQRQRAAGLTVNREKCAFGCSTMKYLGHIVGNDGLRTDPAKVQAIFDFPTPTNVKQLERFLGMVTWYAKFIPHLASLAFLLNQLRHKGVKWQWTDECNSALTTLKTVLTSEPILVYPDLSQPFTVQTDASNRAGLGAVLLQKDGDMYAIAYASRSLCGPEQNYSTTERECLAVVWALEKWRVYLEGQRCKVVPNHQALTWLFRKATLTGRLARWVLRLQDFCFDVTYRPGVLHTLPDALSRAHEKPTVGALWQNLAEEHQSDSGNDLPTMPPVHAQR